MFATIAANEMWCIITDCIQSSQHSKYITGYNEIKIKVLPSTVSSIKQKVRSTGISPGYYADTSYQYYYLTHPSLCQIIPPTALFKMNNKCPDIKDQTTGETIEKVIGAFLINKMHKMEQSLRDKIKRSLKDKIKGEYSIYRRADCAKLGYKAMRRLDVTFINDMILGFHWNNKCVKVIFSCNKLDVLDGRIDGDNSVLSTYLLQQTKEMISELAKHEKFDVNFDSVLSTYCVELNKTLKKHHVECNRLNKLLLKLLRGQIEYDLDRKVPQKYLYLLAEARAQVSLQSKSNICGSEIDRYCNICGMEKQEKVLWLWCKKHGHCHASCSPLGSLCCPHCN